MDGFHNSSKRMRINMVMFLMIGSCVQISTAISDSCPISPSTVKIVDDCPDSEEKWREAAARKNCSAHASQCDEPDRLVYHCVINAFVNQTLEVCAYSRIIMLGYCTEYSLGGNIIQPSFVANCTQFTKKPCPLGYQSTDAFKYPGCYGLTKKTTAMSTLSTTNDTHVNNDEGSSKDVLLPILTVSGCLLLITGIGIVLYMYRKEICSLIRKKDYNKRNEEEYLNDTVDTETEHTLIAPSGQIIGNGHIALPSRP